MKTSAKYFGLAVGH